MPHPLNTTSHALLGLLALRSWTAYELTGQMRRALRWAWPRSEANLYNEVRRLVPEGLAEAEEETAGVRTRTRYRITDDGRAAVADWLRTPPEPPQVQFEALLRVFLADLGTTDDLRATIADTRRQVTDDMAAILPVLEDYAGEDVPFPERAHLNVLFIDFIARFFRDVLEWCDRVDAELDEWGTTAEVGMTAGTRRMLDDTIAFYRASIARHRDDKQGLR